MNATLIQHSVTVVGEAHNPSILSPDFLVHQDIVPKAWGWEVAENFTTPPLAVVRYKTNVAITVEPNKLQVTDGDIENDPMGSKAAAIAKAYVSTLPHVRYTAVGTNFQSILDDASPEELLKSRFLKSGPWTNSVCPLQAAGLRLVYVFPDGARATVSIDAGKASDADEQDKRPVVIVRANFHRTCGDHPTHQQVLEHLGKVESDWNAYQKLLFDAVVAD